MKLRALAAAVLVMAFAAAVAHAATGQSFGLGAGLSMPVGDWTDAAGTGFHFGGNYTYNVSPQFGLGADLDYHMLGEKSGSVDDGGTLLTVKLRTSALQASAHARFFFPVNGAKAEPYFRVGLGLYNLGEKVSAEVTDGVSTVSGSATASESKVGYNIGLGLLVRNSDKSGIGIEALYHMIPLSNDTQLATPTNSSGDASALNLFTVGVTYNFLLPK